MSSVATRAGAPAIDSQPSAGRAVAGEEAEEISRFLFAEARLLDESRYGEWEALLDEDMYYWIPRGEGDFDPQKHLSIAADNRRRLASRVRQLQTGTRYSQCPPSPMCRMLSNIEPTCAPSGEYRVFCKFVLYEYRVQSVNELFVWPGRIEYRIRRKNGDLKMFFKKVVLINGAGPLPSIGFIL